MSESTATFDERTMARAFTIGLPIVTVLAAGVVGVVVGPATSILVILAGVLLGVIALLWGSIRTLTGEAPLPPELEALEMDLKGVDALSVRKKMLLRALKDLENERAIGKIEDDDYASLSSNYREELKAVLRKIDASIEPHRGQAESAVRAHLARVGLSEGTSDGTRSRDASAPSVEVTPTKVSVPSPTKSERVSCPSCQAKNEADAKFCKECATKLVREDSSTKDAKGEAVDA